ncbi:hypothetical protein HPB48_022636 [Haemaphysalis longicornis]|uniref:Uncharacterized protein n=1 Tax=Haemaphysalis longicornis TaxID=44386 RepID=A0A9J6GBC4_HAELO|nr:hypothetical protein HPB48_022636 [Haemaphysalis longicornis]
MANTVVTDSQKACRHFQVGKVHAATCAILLRHPQLRQIQIVWTAAHLRVKVNVKVKITRRTRSEDAASERFFPLLAYAEMTQLLCHARRTLAPPHRHQSTEQAPHHRALQTNAFRHPKWACHNYARITSHSCTFCGEDGTLVDAPSHPLSKPNLYNTPEPWGAHGPARACPTTFDWWSGR